MFLGSPLGGPPLNDDIDQPVENHFTVVSPTGSNKQVVPDSEDEEHPDLLGSQVNQNESMPIPDLEDANAEEEGEQEIDEPNDEEAGEDEQSENVMGG